MSEKRIYCPLAPCLPVSADGIVSNETIRQSASFPTTDAYERHVVRGHFIARVNAPKPYRLAAVDEAAA